MGIEFTNHTDHTIIIRLVTSRLRALQDYPLLPSKSFKGEPGDSGRILYWTRLPAAFNHDDTSATVYGGLAHKMRSEGLNKPTRQLNTFLKRRCNRNLGGLQVKITAIS